MVVMVITHDGERRDKILDYLRRQGYEACVAGHRQEVVAVLKDKKPDLVVLDMYLAQPNAVDNLRRIRGEGFTGKVVVLAGDSSSSTLAEVSRLGVSRVVGGVHAIDGPFDAGQVGPAIKEAFREEIGKRAHELWVQAGRQKGEDLPYWLEAERQILGLEPRPPQAG